MEDSSNHSCDCEELQRLVDGRLLDINTPLCFRPDDFNMYNVLKKSHKHITSIKSTLRLYRLLQCFQLTYSIF